ncbi:MAG: hypothetical protein AB1758_17055 [Candidatus Eremiobacterota bacterium]
MSAAERRGITLLEALLGAVLGFLLLTLLLRTLLPMSRGLTRGASQTELQQSAMLSVEQVCARLAETPVEGITLLPGARALSLQPVTNVNASGRQVWADRLTVYWWDRDAERLYRRTWPPAPPDLGRVPGIDRPFRPLPGELQQVLDPNRVDRVMARSVERFEVSLNGTTATVVLGLRAPAPGGGAPEGFQLERQVMLRNETY